MSDKTTNIKSESIERESDQALGKGLIQLKYQQCAQHADNWEALGRNYTAVQTERAGMRHVIFHLLDLNTVNTGISVGVSEKGRELVVTFPPSGGYSNVYHYRMGAIPRQPFRNPERIRAWDDFVLAMLS
jgi:hypothetical protein